MFVASQVVYFVGDRDYKRVVEQIPPHFVIYYRERTSGQRPEASTPLPTLDASRPKVLYAPGPG